MKKMQWAVLALTTMFAFTACEKDNPTENFETENVVLDTTPMDVETAEEAFPGQTAPSEKMYFGLNPLNVSKIQGQYVFEGDMLFTPEQLSKRPTEGNRSTGRLFARWDNNTVPYEIDPNLPNQQRIFDAIADWESNTDVRLIPRTTETDYVVFTPSTGCSSFVGRIGGAQGIFLANGCSTGNTIHEIGHAVGLWHEQSRIDRDEYINILFENIQPGREFNFFTYAEQGFDGDEFTPELDFDSVMLYGSFFFSANGQPTITRLDGSVYDVNRTSLSAGDIQGISQMYPGGDPDPDICDGVDTYSGDQSYSNGDQVKFQGKLFERTGNRWTFIGTCGEPIPDDVCDGVAPFDRDFDYSIGDLMTRNGKLFVRINGDRFLRVGICGAD